MRRTLGVLVLVSISVAVSGCSGGDDGSTASGDGGASAAGGASAGGATSSKGGSAGSGGKATGGASAGSSASGGVAGSVGKGGGSAAGGNGVGGNGVGGNGVGGNGVGGKGVGGSSAGANGVGGNGTGGASAGSGGVGGSGNAGASGGTGGGALLGPFRHGMNMGAPPAGWTDQDQGWLGAQSGADSNRIVLPEYFLDKWGVGIRTDAAQSYLDDGMSELVCFLIGPTRPHSTAPASAPDWQLDWYIAQNLYEPIFGADGNANPNNYWAAYVAETVTTYKPWIQIWEVWNEPDWVSDYNVTLKWTTEAPTKAQLPRFNGSIHDYVRMLRITTEVAKKIDPNAKIALGGIGYPSFLSALLRYTDEPNAGAVTADYPAKGGAYFDVLNYHYYPVFGTGNSDAGVDGFFALRDSFAAELTKAGVTGKTWNATETGAPRLAFGKTPGGPEYARNYLLKVMLQAQTQPGFLGIDWFGLADGSTDGQSTDPFQFMGLYRNTSKLAKKEDAMRTDTGVAYTTLGKLWKGAKHDPSATAALGLPANVAGGVFSLANGKTGLALWARGTDEAATATYAYSTMSSLSGYAWDYAITNATTSLAPSGGKATLPLTSAPTFFVVNLSFARWPGR